MNNSLLSIFIAGVFIFCFSFLLGLVKTKFGKLVFVCSVAVIAIVLALLGGRAGILGLLCAAAYTWAQHRHKGLRLQHTLLLLLLCVGLAAAKLASSQGRLLIYKVTFSQLEARDYIFGLGLHGFKTRYNNMQAGYFMQNGLDTNEALLADDVQYLYNDWLQFCLELGMAGLLITAVIAWLLKEIFIKAKAQADKIPLLMAANATLVCIGVAALFSFPLHNTCIVWLFVFCLLIHTHYTHRLRPVYANRLIQYLKNGVVATLLALAAVNTGIQGYAKRVTKQSAALMAAGYKLVALEKLQTISHWPFTSGESLFQHAFLLYQINKPLEALACINQSERFNSSHLSMQLKGDILYSLKQYPQAEQCYLSAVYMIPNRLRSKYQLMQFYKNTGEVTKARYWQHVLLTQPVKINSPEAVRLKELAAKF
jgi:tetratricopeptide (TPR) repeat protein